MYSSCLFCNHSLGSNEAVESFPIGRRLAFDQRKGRLWVVCRRCEKWNLTPFEERWEAIEACERLFRDERQRYSTDHIGLARLSEGLELVRIGEPLRPEYAAWRYGDQFKRRFYRNTAYKVSGAVIPFAYVSLGTAAGIAGIAAFTTWNAATTIGGIIRDRRIVARVADASGKDLIVRRGDAALCSLVPGERDEEWGISLRTPFSGRQRTVFGETARRTASLIVPHFNPGGGRQKTVGQAAERLEAFEPQRFLAWAARNRPSSWFAFDYWLAIEMAVNEENERHALEGELHHLEYAWKSAEELAAIADKLVLPSAVEEKFASLRRQKSSGNNL